MIRRPPRSPLFPYPTLFRSKLLAVAPSCLWVVRAGDIPAESRKRWPQAGREAQMFAAADHVVSLLDGCLRRSEEHTSELQSQSNLVCRLLLEKKHVWRSFSH